MECVIFGFVIRKSYLSVLWRSFEPTSRDPLADDPKCSIIAWGCWACCPHYYPTADLMRAFTDTDTYAPSRPSDWNDWRFLCAAGIKRCRSHLPVISQSIVTRYTQWWWVRMRPHGHVAFNVTHYIMYNIFVGRTNPFNNDCVHSRSV